MDQKCATFPDVYKLILLHLASSARPLPYCKDCRNNLSSTFYSWTTRGSVSSWSSPAPPVKNEFASMNRSAITSESARREHSTASTARSHFTSKTSRLDMIYLDSLRCSARLGRCSTSQQLIVCLLKETLSLFFWGFFQAHDEICPKYPMICEGCAKKKIPREKVSL